MLIYAYVDLYINPLVILWHMMLISIKSRCNETCDISI